MPELAASPPSLLIRAGRQSVNRSVSVHHSCDPNSACLREPEEGSRNQARQAQERAKPPFLATDI